MLLAWHKSFLQLRHSRPSIALELLLLLDNLAVSS